EGDRFDLFFEEEWKKWLKEELAAGAARAGAWRAALAKADLRDMKEAARALASPLVDLEQASKRPEIKKAAGAWKAEMEKLRAANGVPAKAAAFQLKVEAIENIFSLAEKGKPGEEELLEILAGWNGDAPKSWEDGASRRKLKDLTACAKAL